MDNFFLILLWILLNSASCFEVRATVGKDCELPWNYSTNSNVSTLRWTHSEEKKVLLLYRGGKVLTDEYHPEYRERVELKHFPPKNDLSVKLKNVKSEDSGIYECWVKFEDSHMGHLKIHLTVDLKNEADSTGTLDKETDTEYTLDKETDTEYTLDKETDTEYTLDKETDTEYTQRHRHVLFSVLLCCVLFTSFLIYFTLKRYVKGPNNSPPSELSDLNSATCSVQATVVLLHGSS